MYTSNVVCVYICGSTNSESVLEGKFNIGENVNFLNETGSGVVTSVLPNGEYIILDEDGFEEAYKERDLVRPILERDLHRKSIVKPLLQEEPTTNEIKEELILSENGFHIGEQVRPLDETGQGVISHFNKEMVFVKMDEGITLDFHYTKLVSTKKENDRSLIAAVEKEKDVFKREDFLTPVKAKPTERKSSGVWEIDLHVHEITEETDNLTAHQLMQIQMDYFELKLNEAISRQVRKVIFIHGRGKGKLKNEIRKVLDRYPNCEYLDGSYRNYGIGATEVLIRNLG